MRWFKIAVATLICSVAILLPRRARQAFSILLAAISFFVPPRLIRIDLPDQE